jgi:hypothetical protein
MTKHWRGIVTSFLLGLACVTLVAQATNISSSGTLPTHCTVGNVYIKTGASAGLYRCSATDTWTQLQDLLGSITEALLSFSDVTTANATTSQHGLMPKADGTSTHYWGGDAAWHALGTSGGTTLLEEHTASSSASLTFTTRNVTGQSGATFQSDFDEYEIHVVSVIPATTTVDLQFQASTDGGVSYDSTSGHYTWQLFFAAFNATSNNGSTSTTASSIAINLNNSSTIACSGRYRLYSPLSTSVYKVLEGQASCNDNSRTTDSTTQLVSAKYAVSGSAMNAMQFLMSSGNIASGTIRIFGIAK